MVGAQHCVTRCKFIPPSATHCYAPTANLFKNNLMMVRYASANSTLQFN
jgi:hypothetical protein